jgi:hypothetical protein
MRSTRNVQPISRGLLIGLAVVVVLTIGVGHGAMGSELFIIALYLIGATIAGVAWTWDFRWKQLAWTLGVLILGYSIASMILTGQFWLALGALALMAPIIVVPSIYKVGQQMKRDRLR